MKTKPLVAAFATLVLTAGSAAALPSVGSPRPSVSIRDGWDRETTLERYRGVVTLVVYEDKGSAEVNQALKEELSRLAKGDRYKRRVALFAVADVTGYDYWPVRGFVKDAIQSESHKQGTLIYCDWDGRFRGALGLHKGNSNVVLIGKDDRILFAEAGALSAARRRELIDLLRREVEGH